MTITDAIDTLKKRIEKDTALLNSLIKEKNKPIKVCVLCQKELGRRQKMFCSVKCRNTSNGLNHVGCKKQVHMFCRMCGKNYTINLARKDSSKYCSKECHRQAQKAIFAPLQEAVS